MLVGATRIFRFSIVAGTCRNAHRKYKRQENGIGQVILFIYLCQIRRGDGKGVFEKRMSTKEEILIT